jgi:hypothetical protein
VSVSVVCAGFGRLFLCVGVVVCPEPDHFSIVCWFSSGPIIAGKFYIRSRLIFRRMIYQLIVLLAVLAVSISASELIRFP